MTEWRNIILDKIRYITSSKIFISDYEALLSDDEILVAIKEIGFNYLFINADVDNIEVRYQYENFFRNNNSDGERGERLLVILQDKERNKTDLPYDIVFGSTDVTLDLSDIFPCIDPAIVRLLDHGQYGDLFRGIEYESLSGTILTRQQSLIFVLRNVFHIHLLEIKNDVDFAALLFDIHYNGSNIPEEIAKEVENFFRKNERFDDWKIKELLTSSSLFWNYIQQLWDSLIGYQFYYWHDGVESLDILNPKLVIYLDNAFSSGYLKARIVSTDDSQRKLEKIPESLSLLGIIHEDENSIEVIEKKKTNLFERVSAWNINDKSTYKDWLDFSQLYSQWLNLIEKSGKESKTEFNARKEINKAFASWLFSHFDALCYETTAYPLMVFRILPYLAKRKRLLGDGGRIALIVIDGMSYSDWITIKTELSATKDKLSFEEHTCFAWIPTLTSVSRQVIFSGKFPRDFSKTIGTTSNEEKEWLEAWTRSFPLMPNSKIKYLKAYDESDEGKVLSMIDNLSVFGIVINAVDELLHSSHVLGSAGLHNNIKQWVDTRLLENLITQLLGNDFQVFITADHGNTSVVGTGRINEGKLATEKGQRARIYNSSTLRTNANAESPESIEWNSSTLPSDYLPLLSSFGSAFIPQGEKEITHGGISIEEVIVPFIEVKRNV